MIATGLGAKFGQTAQMTTPRKMDSSPRQQELDHMAKKISEFALIISFFTFIIGIIQQEPFYKMFLYAISLAVAVVPEGLPATVTIALAIGVQKLLRKNALVKHLASVETLGCTKVICTDKTGTLTQNQMTVTKVFADKTLLEVTGQGYSSDGEIKGDLAAYEQTVRIGYLCNNVNLQKTGSKESATQGHHRKFIGDPTEIALYVLAEKAGFDIAHMQRRYIRVYEHPFDSDRKMMTVVCEDEEAKKNTYAAYTKGGPRQILERCSHMLVKGRRVRMTKAAREKLLAVNHRMADQALRVLACAYTDIKPPAGKRFTKKWADQALEQKMTFSGFVGMMDPPRAGVTESLRDSRRAGISVMMITGDQPNTALAIAKRIGLVSEDATRDVLMTGSMLERMSKEELAESLGHIQIFARVSPEQKIAIVRALKKAGKVTAMTGDGVNDAPALKKSDIGVAMGSGTDVSKEAANMVLLDDSFTTIVEAIRFGRGIYENIKKFIWYVLSGIGTELVVVMASMFSPLPLAISAVQILWIDLGTEVLPALALSVDPIHESVMEKKPRSRKAHIMDKAMILKILRVSLYQGGVLLLLFWWVGSQHQWSDLGLRIAQTMTFTGLILFQMVNVFNCRDDRASIFSGKLPMNWWVVGGVLISIILQILIVYHPLGNMLFGTVPLAATDWILMSGIALTIVPYQEIWKYSLRKRDTRSARRP